MARWWQLLSCLLLTCYVTGLKVESSTYEIIDHEFTGFRVKMAVFDTLFDNDLYVSNGFFCLPFQPGVSKPDSPCLCDYASNTCGKASGSGCSCSSEPRFCSPSFAFKELPIDGVFSDTVDRFSRKYYRMFFPSFNSGYRITVVNSFGRTDLFASWTDPDVEVETADYVQTGYEGFTFVFLSPFEGFTFVFLCPSMNDFKGGTLFIRIDAITASAYEIISERVDVQEADPVQCSQEEKNSNLEEIGSRTCVTDGYYDREQKFTNGVARFYYSVSKCVTITVTTHPIVPVSQGRPWVDFVGALNNQTVIEDTRVLGLVPVRGGLFFNTLGEMAASWGPYSVDSVTVCPDKGNDVFYLNMATRGSSYAWIFRAEENPQNKLRLADIPPSRFRIMMKGEFLLECDGLLPLQCQNDLTVDCQAVFSQIPSVDVQPLWPIPYILLGEQQFSELLPINATYVPNPKLHRIIFWLGDSVPRYSQYVADSTAETCVIKYRGTFIDANNKPNFETVKPSPVAPPICDKDKFGKISAEMRGLLENISESSSVQEINKLRLQVDTFSVQPTWRGCKNFVLGLSRKESSSTFANRFLCARKNTDPLFLSDNCCNPVFDSGCCESKSRVESVDLLLLNQGSLKRSCTNPKCAAVVDELLLAAENQDKSECAKVPVNDDISVDIFSTYAECKTKHLGREGQGIECWKGDCRTNLIHGGIPCRLDSDCPGTHTCNLLLQRCDISPEDQTLNFLRCFTSYILEFYPTIFEYFRRVHDIKDGIVDDFVTAVDKAYRKEQCAGSYNFAFPHRSTLVLGLKSNSSCSVSFSCKYYVDIDQLSVHEPESCRDTCTGTVGWAAYERGQSECDEGFVCNWKRCDGLSKGQCKDECVSSSQEEFFCGVCTNDGECVPVQGIFSESECNGKVCLLSNGTAIRIRDDENCEDFSSCTEECFGYTCENFGLTHSLCVDLNSKNSTMCEGTWDVLNSVCIVSENVLESQCKSPFSYQTCQMLGKSECLACTYNLDECPILQSKLQCHENWRVPCENRESCEKTGKCSDESYFVTKLPSASYSIRGACKIADLRVPSFPRFPARRCFRSGYYTPEFCAAPLPTSKCVGVYRYPSDNKDDCLSHAGCTKTLLWRYGDLALKSFFPRESAECLACDGVYKPLYEWEDGRWQEAVLSSVAPSWRKKEVIFPYKMRDSFDFKAFADAVIQSINFASTFAINAQTQCLYSRAIALMPPIVCDCLEGGSGESCYNSKQELNVLQGTAVVCKGISTAFVAEPVTVITSDNSVNAGCSFLQITQIFLASFYETPNKRLSTSFVPRRELKPYEIVYNDNDGLVGQLVGSGQRISRIGSDIPKNIILCSQPSFQAESKYDVADFAVPLEVDGEVVTKFIPLNGKWLKFYRGTDVCVQFDELDSNLYVPIMRLANWKSESKNEYDDGERAIMYILASMYAIVVLLVIISLLVIAVVKEIHFLNHNLITILIGIHSLFRAVYFYLLPSDVFSENDDTVEYVLFELPIFILFTIFTW
eukprot:CAMPEP_0177688218 /NCGR_PEP_ID=MMETSP0447-20121125/34543_1 /TAXON_ID=0 /ORGANISM="Stygamoeba regulata, Strain BSH-02190019" /LENGTH=1515 /DNA_ID=CAMNT_0019198509 /DNA_START=90 /DNA_END=4634 /DNA_ORIENTATION=+